MLNCAIVFKPIIARVHRHLLRPAIKSPVRHLHKSIAPKLAVSSLVCSVVGGSVPGWLPAGPTAAREAVPTVSSASPRVTTGAAPVEAFLPAGDSGNSLLSRPLSGLFVSAQESAETTQLGMMLPELNTTFITELAPVEMLEQPGTAGPSAVPEPQSILSYLIAVVTTGLYGLRRRTKTPAT